MTAAASATASHGTPYHYIAHRKCVTLRQPPAASGDGGGGRDAAPFPSSSTRSRLGSCGASADKYRVADVEDSAAPPAAAPDAAAVAGAHNRLGAPERLIRGRCRQMLREEWVSLAEVWYRASPPDAQRLFRRLLRCMHGEEAPAVLGSLSRDSVTALLRTDQSRDCYTQAASSYALGAQVPEAQARVLRRARVLLKVYLSPVLRPAYHAGAFYWCVKHSGTPGVEDDVRTVFSGIASFAGYKFSAYTRQFARTSDGGSLVAGRVLPLHQTLRAASAAAAATARLPGLRRQPLADGEGELARSFEQVAAAAKEAQQQQQQAGGDGGGAGGGGAARAGSARTVRHWAAQGLLRPARRVPPWLMDSKGAGAWESTSREHFSARQDRGAASAAAAAAAAAAGSGGGGTCAGGGGRRGGPGTGTGPWVFSAPGQALAVAKVTASVNGCLPRCLSPPPPARQSGVCSSPISLLV